VTGAGKRLGRAMALYLAERGYDVAVHYASSADAAEEVVAEIARWAARRWRCRPICWTRRRRRRCAARHRGAGRAAHLLVNNASIFEYDTIDTGLPEDAGRLAGRLPDARCRGCAVLYVGKARN
jgi:NAD(P)-dependent dehydrogenase (short-subunit alcohol dehydrogenase family)